MDTPAPPPAKAPVWLPRAFHPFLEMNRYHWWVLAVCILGWTFDTMDQRLYVLARPDAMKEFAEKRVEAMDEGAIAEAIESRAIAVADGQDPRPKLVADIAAASGKWVNLWFIWGWATGGILFGVLGDKIGRTRTMVITILVYALFTASSGFTRNVWQFSVCRFLTGLGVGGEFAAGVALLAEVIPERPRPLALGLMQGLSAAGNITGSLLGLMLKRFRWPALFYVGAIPALLVVVIRMKVKEPESWLHAKSAADAGGRRVGSYRDLFSHARWRRHAIVGMIVAIAGVTGLWGIGFYTPELVTRVHEAELAASIETTGAPPAWALDRIDGEPTPEKIEAAKNEFVKTNRAWMTMFQDIGAFFSMFGFALVAAKIGRKKTFLLCFGMAFASVVGVFGFFTSPSQLWWMGLILGFGTLSLFGGYAVYFPEIFPTRLRSTGVALCYNVGRYAAGFIQESFPKAVKRGFDARWPTGLKAYRATNIAMAFVYVAGAIAILFGPETAGRPLPEDDDGGAA